MIDHIRDELYRCKVGDVIKYVDACHALWKAKALDDKGYLESSRICELYLDNYLDSTKRQINGKEFADITKHVGSAKFHGIYSYSDVIVSKLERDLLAYHAENTLFTVSDLMNMFTAFDRVSSHQALPKLIDAIVAKLPDAVMNSDGDMLKLFKAFHRFGMLEKAKYEHLCLFVQEYATTKFEMMRLNDALAFAQFFHEVGIWYWDHHLMAQIENNFATNFVQYDISQISKLVYLAGNNYTKSEPFLAHIEDSLRMRLNFIVKNAVEDGQKWSDYYDAQTLSLLVDGLGALG